MQKHAEAAENRHYVWQAHDSQTPTAHEECIEWRDWAVHYTAGWFSVRPLGMSAPTPMSLNAAAHCPFSSVFWVQKTELDDALETSAHLAHTACRPLVGVGNGRLELALPLLDLELLKLGDFGRVFGIVQLELLDCVLAALDVLRHFFNLRGAVFVRDGNGVAGGEGLLSVSAI